MPEGLMFRMPRPAGVPDYDHPIGRQLYSTKFSTAFESDPEEEIGAIIRSITQTFSRAEYHYLRFLELRAALDENRRSQPGEVFFDEFTSCVHFELQAMCGAARYLLEELTYLIARRHGSASAAARSGPWQATALIEGSLQPGSLTDVPEVRLLREHKEWFSTLNAYRNSFFHNGWQHGGGHFDREDGRAAASIPSMNALLVPDRSSLRRTKPFEWTWNERTTVDEVAEEVHRGLHGVVHELCEREWATPVPPPGTAPREHHPNLMVRLIKPAVIVTDDALIVPFFTQRDRAAAFEPFRADPRLELAELHSSSMVIADDGFSFSLSGLESNVIPPGVSEIHVVLDPGRIGRTAADTTAEHRAVLRIKDVLAAGPIQPISAVFGVEKVYVWREPRVMPWLSRANGVRPPPQS